MKSKYKKIKTVEALYKATNEESFTDFVIALGGGAMVSRKEIMREGKKFLINNCIDDTEQDLTEKQLMNEKITNIGVAMKKGAFYQLI